MKWDDEETGGSDWWYIGVAAVLCLAVIVLMLWDLVGRLGR